MPTVSGWASASLPPCSFPATLAEPPTQPPSIPISGRGTPRSATPSARRRSALAALPTQPATRQRCPSAAKWSASRSRESWGESSAPALIAIVLGVAMVAGTFMLTDSIDKAFDSIFTAVRKGSNAVISGKSAFDLSEGSGTNSPTLDESLLPEVRRLPSVAEAEGSVDGEAQLIGEDGKAIVYGGAPNLGFSVASGDSPFNPLTLVEGAWPKAGELVVDESTADKEGF